MNGFIHSKTIIVIIWNIKKYHVQKIQGKYFTHQDMWSPQFALQFQISIVCLI